MRRVQVPAVWPTCKAQSRERRGHRHAGWPAGKLNALKFSFNKLWPLVHAPAAPWSSRPTRAMSRSRTASSEAPSPGAFDNASSARAASLHAGGMRQLWARPALQSGASQARHSKGSADGWNPHARHPALSLTCSAGGARYRPGSLPLAALPSGRSPAKGRRHRAVAPRPQTPTAAAGRGMPGPPAPRGQPAVHPQHAGWAGPDVPLTGRPPLV